MKLKLFFGLAMFATATITVKAQENVESLYIRNSVYMLKIDRASNNEDYTHAYEVTNNAFDGIDFSKRYANYNNFSLPVRHIDWAMVPEASVAELDSLGQDSAKDVMLRSMLVEMGINIDPISDREYAARLLKYFNANKFGNQLVAKWHVADGADYSNVESWDNELSVIMDLGMKGLSDEARENAKKTENITALCGNSENKLLSTTYICVNDYRMMTAEEKSATTIALAKVALEYLPSAAKLAGSIAVKAAEVAAKKVKGFFVRTNSYLFKLDWDQDKFDNFYANYWNNPNEFNNKANYQLKYVGKSSKYAGAGLTMKSDNIDRLITRGALRATDAAFAALQRDYEEFRPMSSLHVEDGKLIAYIGTKEGVKDGDKFDVFQRVENEDKTYDWKKVGNIKVAKKSVWDNQEGAGDVIEGAAEDGNDDEGSTELKYTIFSGKPTKNIGEGCLIRLAK